MTKECYGRDCQYWDLGPDCCGFGFDVEDVEQYKMYCPLEQEELEDSHE